MSETDPPLRYADMIMHAGVCSRWSQQSCSQPLCPQDGTLVRHKAPRAGLCNPQPKASASAPRRTRRRHTSPTGLSRGPRSQRGRAQPQAARGCDQTEHVIHLRTPGVWVFLQGTGPGVRDKRMGSEQPRITWAWTLSRQQLLHCKFPPASHLASDRSRPLPELAQRLPTSCSAVRVILK